MSSPAKPALNVAPVHIGAVAGGQDCELSHLPKFDRPSREPRMVEL